VCGHRSSRSPARSTRRCGRSPRSASPSRSSRCSCRGRSGITDATDPQFARTYFWFTGHPLVYFWLLPAYVSWYGMLPKQCGGKLFSDSLARLSFWMFLIVSVPVGFHHQFVDPGVPQVWKWIHAILTYSVFFPSDAHGLHRDRFARVRRRKRGGTGHHRLGARPAVERPVGVGQLLAGILFMFGGIERSDERLVQHQPRDPQHRVGARPLPPHGRDRGDVDVHRHHLLARAASRRQAAVGPQDGRRPGRGCGSSA
jgi:hypothetical protein